MGGGLGGKQSTQVQVPAWLEGAAQQLMGRANDISRIGYTPYYGPDVAAQTGDQLAAQGMNRGAAAAFGLDPAAYGGGGGAAVPPPETFAGGVQGYSSAPMYTQAKEALKAAAPGQFDLLQGQFVNPITGAAPAGVTMSSGGAAAPAAVKANPVNPMTLRMAKKKAETLGGRHVADYQRLLSGM